MIELVGIAGISGRGGPHRLKVAGGGRTTTAAVAVVVAVGVRHVLGVKEDVLVDLELVAGRVPAQVVAIVVQDHEHRVEERLGRSGAQQVVLLDAHARLARRYRGRIRRGRERRRRRRRLVIGLVAASNAAAAAATSRLLKVFEALGQVCHNVVGQPVLVAVDHMMLVDEKYDGVVELRLVQLVVDARVHAVDEGKGLIEDVQVDVLGHDGHERVQPLERKDERLGGERARRQVLEIARHYEQAALEQQRREYLDQLLQVEEGEQLEQAPLSSTNYYIL